MTGSFGRMATVTASTLRPPAMAGGQRGAPQPYLSGLAVLPLMPLDARTQMVMGLDTPVGLLQTFAQGDVDVRAGDVLVVGGVEYPVRWVGRWPWGYEGNGGTVTVQIVVEEVRL